MATLAVKVRTGEPSHPVMVSPMLVKKLPIPMGGIQRHLGMAGRLPATNTTAMVSPMARPAPSTTPGSGSRFLNGTLEMHLELEAELGKFLRKPGIVTFGTGYQSNVGIISALVDRHDYVICDRENHASIYAGCQMSYGKMLRYRHSDMEELEKCLQRVPEKNGALIVTDGVFSMGGDIAKLPEICALAKKYGARVMVDDAHGLGRKFWTSIGRPGHGQRIIAQVLKRHGLEP